MVNGVKVFKLVARPVKWKIQSKYEMQPEVWATAWTYNGTVPGPMIRVTEGDRVRVIFKNQLPAPTSIHWHGLPLPNDMDGVSQPDLTQKPVMPGETFTYEFVARPAGTFFYHSHFETDRQINIGLFAPLIINPKRPSRKVDKDVVLMLNEWRIDPATGKTWPAMLAMSEPNYFTINGKVFPDIPTITAKKAQRVRLRFVGAGQFLHPMHLHGMFFKIVATDGNPVPAAQLTKDTLPVTPGERYDVEFVARTNLDASGKLAGPRQCVLRSNRGGDQMELPEPYRKFQSTYPEIWQAYDRLGAALHGQDPLDAKTRELVKLGIAAGARLEGGVHAHTRLALQVGASPDEIRHVALLSLTTIGFPSMMAVLTWTEDVLAAAGRS